MDHEQAHLELEHEKWRTAVRLREQELDLKKRELELKEREQRVASTDVVEFRHP